MLIERPPRLFRMFFRSSLFRARKEERHAGPGRQPVCFLTFDDGPVPEVTPKVLDLLDHYGVQATFFMVGDNVRRNPELLEEVRRRGHAVGNHTMHHLQGAHVTTRRYLRDIMEADALIGSRLFRPPHGWMRLRQARALKREFRLVMYDLVTRDYSWRLNAREVVENVKRYARPGSVIVFHDSLKSEPRLMEALPASIEWLLEQGYRFETITPDYPDK